MLTYGIPPDFRDGVHVFQPPYAIGSVPRVYRLLQLRTDDFHCRESAGTGPVVLKVVPLTSAALQVTMDQLMCASLFPHPLLVWCGHVESIESDGNT